MLRKELTALTLRDFGVYSKGQKFKEDTGSQQPAGYYDKLIDEFATGIRQLLRNLMLNITAANTYPTSLRELELRRMYQNGAITNCKQLKEEIQYCEDVMPIKASVFIPYIEKIEFEIRLLTGWRKSNSKIKEAIENKMKKEGIKIE
jgi:hypothetical protein